MRGQLAGLGYRVPARTYALDSARKQNPRPTITESDMDIVPPQISRVDPSKGMDPYQDLAAEGELCMRMSERDQS